MKLRIHMFPSALENFTVQSSRQCHPKPIKFRLLQNVSKTLVKSNIAKGSVNDRNFLIPE